MTANAMQGDRERCLAAGMDDYVSKPDRVESLEAALNRWIPPAPGRPRHRPAPCQPSPPPGRPGRGSLDPTAFDNLRTIQQPGQPSLVGRLIEMFLQATPLHLLALDEAIECDDAETLVRVAHLLKGNTGNFGAHELQTLCARLEQLGHANALDQAPLIFEQIQVAYQRVATALAALESDPSHPWAAGSTSVTH